METNDHKKNIRIEQIASWLFILSIVVVCLIYFSDFLQPIMLAVMVWYFVYVFRDYFGRVRIRSKPLTKWLRTALAFVFIVRLTFGVIEIVSFNLEKIIERFPTYVAHSKTMFESIKAIEGFEETKDRLVSRITDFDFRPLLSGLLNGMSGFAGNILLIIIYVGFLLVEEKFFTRKLELTAGAGQKGESVKQIVDQINEAVKTYVFVKTQMSLLTGFLSYLVLLMFGVDFPVLWAFIIFLLNYIPYIGSLVATILPAAFAVFQFQNFSIFIWLFLAIQVVQFGVGNVLEPKVMGRTLNLSPLGVLLALTFWGLIWGVLGMILSVPITSILVIIASQVPRLRFVAVWLSETGDINGTASESNPERAD